MLVFLPGALYARAGRTEPVMPPRTDRLAESITAAKDRQYAELSRDAAAWRQLGQLGFILVRKSEWDELKALEAFHEARNGGDAVATPGTKERPSAGLNSETAERKGNRD